MVAFCQLCIIKEIDDDDDDEQQCNVQLQTNCQISVKSANACNSYNLFSEVTQNITVHYRQPDRHVWLPIVDKVYVQTYLWFQSYLRGRSQYIRRGMQRSSSVQLVCGVPQGSVLGPILFIMYTVCLLYTSPSPRD